MFEWKEKYNTGHKEIDLQHQQFFKMGKEINKIIISYSGEDIHEQLYNLFTRLIDYTVYHFEAEEAIMEEDQYPALESHRDIHKQFIEKLNTIDLKQLESAQGELAYHLLKTISSWITTHITGEDMSYINYMKKRPTK